MSQLTESNDGLISIHGRCGGMMLENVKFQADVQVCNKSSKKTVKERSRWQDKKTVPVWAFAIV